MLHCPQAEYVMIFLTTLLLGNKFLWYIRALRYFSPFDCRMRKSRRVGGPASIFIVFNVNGGISHP
jgi:hypothetical protein